MTGAAALPALLGALRRLYSRDAAADPAAAAVLRRVLAALDGAEGPERAPERRLLPACGLLPAALQAAAAGPLAELAAAFAAVEPALAWVQNPNYSDRTMGPGYMAGYAYANVVGPTGLIDRPGVLAGLLLLGPGRLYPDHAHPAAEVYHVVAGRADWRRDGGGWQARDPGACIHHAPWVRHATRIGGETLLAWYCWHGETAVHADLTGVAEAPAGGRVADPAETC